jgi:hypothetical protein
MTLTNGTGKTAVVAVGNGLELSAGCSGFQIQLYIDTTSGNPNSLQMSGTATGGTTGGTLMIEDSNNTASGAEMNGNVLTDFDVIARDSTNGGMAHTAALAPSGAWLRRPAEPAGNTIARVVSRVGAGPSSNETP